MSQWIDIELANFHNAVFVSGTNFQMKIDTNLRREVTLKYNREYGELHVFFLGKMAIVPSTNVSSMIPFPEGAKPVSAPEQPAEKIVLKPFTAQISSPMDHVFAGPGAGKTGKDK